MAGECRNRTCLTVAAACNGTFYSFQQYFVNPCSPDSLPCFAETQQENQGEKCKYSRTLPESNRQNAFVSVFLPHGCTAGFKGDTAKGNRKLQGGESGTEDVRYKTAPDSENKGEDTARIELA